MKKVRLGLVGCGHRGIYIAGLFNSHPDCEVTALMDRFGGRVEQAARALNLPHVTAYTDYEKMLQEAPLDALFFACAPTDQVEMACEAMERGKHACTEVPAAFTLGECWKLVRTVEKTGAKYQLMEQTRYWGFVDAWRAMRERDELGHICLAQGEYVHYERNWGYWTDQETGEVLNTLTPPAGRRVEPTWRYEILGDPIYYLPHTLSPLLKILDDRVESVSCMGTQRHSYTYPDQELPWRDIEYALMHTAKDTVLLAGAGFSLPHPGRGPTGCHWYELRGTRGTVESPRGAWDSFRVWRPGMASHEKMDLSMTPLDASEEQAKTGHGGADFKPVDSFIRSILDDTTPPLDVYLTAELTAPAIVAAESARRGGALMEVPDFRPRGK
jgi:predicted dehydrogenase